MSVKQYFLNSITVPSGGAATPTPESSWSLFGKTDSVPVPPDISSDVWNSGESLKDGVGGNSVSQFTVFLGYAETVANILIGLSVIWLLINFVVMATQLAQYGDNPAMRQKVLDNFKRNLLAIAILGGLSTIASISMRLFIG